jgi:hypothetical protein
MTSPTDSRLAAAGAILGVVAMDVQAAVAVINTAMGADDLAQAVAAVALLQRVGLLADEAAAKLGQRRVDDPENWTACPAAQRALEQLGKGAR